MNVIIRQILEANSVVISDLCRQFGYEQPVAQTRENIIHILTSPGHNAFVAVHDEQIIGWIGVCRSIQIESEPICEIKGLVVHEDFRQMGFGRMLVEKAVTWGRERSMNKIRLRCNNKRKEAHLFYGKLGFIEIKEQKVFDRQL